MHPHGSVPDEQVWYCANCGYEVRVPRPLPRVGEKLVASGLPVLESLDEDDEVGYRIEDWEDWERGRLIVALNELEIHAPLRGRRAGRGR